MTALQLRQERAKVWGTITDLRGKRTNGKFTDPTQQAAYDAADAEFERLTTEMLAAEVAEEHEKQHASRAAQMESETRQRAAADAKPESKELTYGDAFWRWAVQHKDRYNLTADEMRMIQTRATDTQIAGTSNLGGYLVPQAFMAELEMAMKHYGGMIEACGIMQRNSGAQLRWPTGDDTGNTGRFITETGAAAVLSMTFGQVLFDFFSVTSDIIKVSADLMTDEEVGFLQQILLTILPERLGRALNTKFTNGTGTNEVYGLTTTVTTSALTTAGGTAITQAELLRAVYSVNRAYRAGQQVGWMWSDGIMAYIRGTEIGNTNTVPIFTPSVVQGEPDKLFGYKIFINNDLPDTHATTRLPVTATKSVYFGDFSKFKIMRVGGIHMSKEEHLYWATREVGFMGWERVASNLIAQGAIKYILQA